jgi:hypothetical protein
MYCEAQGENGKLGIANAGNPILRALFGQAMRGWLCIAGLAMAALPIPALAEDILPPKVYTTTPGGVNIADGSFVYTQTDLQIGPLALERFHLGGEKDPNAPFFGTHMSHNYDIYVVRRFVSAVVGVHPAHTSAVVHFGTSASGTYYQPLAFADMPLAWQDHQAKSGQLEIVGGAYIYVDAGGTVYTFNPSIPVTGLPPTAISLYTVTQRIGSIAFPDGRTQTFTYNSSGQLKEVRDSSGYALIFDYASSSSTDMRVVTACGFDLARDYVTATSTCTGATLKAGYSYSGNLLASSTDVLGYSTTYAYGGNEITCIKPPGYSTCKVANVYSTVLRNEWQVVQQTLADGSVWHFVNGSSFARDSDYIPSNGDEYAYVTDPAGKLWTYSFTGTSPFAFYDPYGKITEYRYFGSQDYESGGGVIFTGSNMAEATMPEGNKYLVEYEATFLAPSKRILRAKPGSGLPDRVEQYFYGGPYGDQCTPPSRRSCAKPLWKKDAKGNQTDYSYHDFGGIISEMQPAPTSGAARPLKLASYVQKYAYIKNSGGALVAAAAPVWLPDTETLCQTTAGSSTPTCDSAAPITVTSYEYGANGTVDNLLLRGKVVTSGGVSLRTCYGYDAQSNKISETSPRAGLASCP